MSQKKNPGNNTTLHVPQSTRGHTNAQSSGGHPVSDLVIQQAQNLLGSFGQGNRGYQRDIEFTGSVDGKTPLNTYNTLLAPLRLRLHFARDTLSLMNAETGRLASPEQSGVSTKPVDSKRLGSVQLNMTPETFMRLCAAWGYNAARKLTDADKRKWPDIQSETPPYTTQPMQGPAR